MVAKLKLERIDGRAPPCVGQFDATREISPKLDLVGIDGNAPPGAEQLSVTM
jgi:hypothetical protein